MCRTHDVFFQIWKWDAIWCCFWGRFSTYKELVSYTMSFKTPITLLSMPSQIIYIIMAFWYE